MNVTKRHLKTRYGISCIIATALAMTIKKGRELKANAVKREQLPSRLSEMGKIKNLKKGILRMCEI